MIAFINGVDRSVVNFLNGLFKKSPVLNKLAEFLAAWPVYFIPVALIVYWFWAPRWRMVELRATLAGLVAWQVVNRIIQHFVHRGRPIPASVASELIFKRQAEAFPSDHAAFGMALFFALFLAGERQLSWFVLTLTLIFSIFRVVTGFHFPSDILAGWLVGLATGYGFTLIGGWIDRYVGQPLIKLAKLLKLA